MFLIKTDKARQELQPGRRTLGQRERALLLMSDGQRSLTDFGELFGGRDEAGRVVSHLLQEGYLRRRDAEPAPASMSESMSESMAEIKAGAEPESAAIADTFDGKRSLATTRMFLFDLCERMFVRRDPVLAEQFREMLRESRDRETMLTVASAMLEEVEKLAGAERAVSIRERIDKLLPAQQLH
ncbi:hypothetical protein VAR608DRAFT_6454 [Variovorax sp. HW608]|uniref:hypothetical protein n=1 Tax=Variovorax sp. HW608 TaxID=1034889 RepID=UPI00081FE957|nr:hypothetical protein [Variovorax sp. HW608]SCK59507.1 hypothetical protein VAR608DRAFT_6454 [Variovorax sp. HW608]